MEIPMDATKKLAAFAAGVKYEDLSDETVRMTKQFMLDWLGVAIRGSQEEPARLLRQVVLTEDGHEATVLSGEGKRANALNAALANGAASHTLDFDDLHNASIIHIATIVVPPVFAVAEKEHRSGKEAIAAAVAGYEIAARVGVTVNPESYYFWHTTATVGAIAAGAAAARALQLDAVQTMHALGSAGTQAAGLWEFVHEGAMSKPLHTGKSCYAGVLSAYLAQAGFTGATQILEGDKGFCRAMLAEPHWEKLLGGLGEGYQIDVNSFKPYPCCKHSHASIYAMQVLQKKHGFKAEEIKHITLLVNSITDSLINNPAPQTVYGCKFSIQYCAACAAVFGNVGIEQFAPEVRSNEAVRKLMERTTVQQDAAIQAVYDANPDKLASKLVVELENGQKYELEVDYPKGDPQNPMTWEESVQKFMALTIPVYGEQKAKKLVEFIDKLEKAGDFAIGLEEALA